MDFGKVKVNLEGAWQQGNLNKNRDFSGYMYSVGAGADLNYAWNPSVFVGYDFYSGDDGKGDFDAFVAPVPNVDKFLGKYNLFDQSAGALLGGDFLTEGIKDLYAKLGVRPTENSAVSFAYHYFTTDEDFATGGDNIGWETDLIGKYRYSKNLCLEAGWSHFDPDSDYAKAYLNNQDDAGDWFYAQAKVSF
jgi:hypothetical protein